MINLKVTDHKGQLHEIQGREGDSLMEALRGHEWGVPAVCGGLLSCGTCQVYIDGDWLDKLPQTDPEEQDLLNEFDSTKKNSRLSCQLKLQASHDGLELTIAPDE